MYQTFMEDYLHENQLSEDKEGVYKVNYYLRDNLQTPYITPKLEHEGIREQIVEFVGAYMDKYANALSKSGPCDMIIFSDTETGFLYDLFGVNKETMIQMYDNMIEEAFYGKISKFITGYVYNAPHKILLCAITIDALQHEYDDVIECCEYLWAFCDYPILFREYWKTGVKEDVMEYTIEHLGAKFTIKKVSNLQGLLKYDAHRCVENKSDELKTGADHAYTNFIYRLRNQLNSKLRNIANAYYKNIETNATQHVKDSEYDDGKIVDQEGHSTNISQIVDKTLSSFLAGSINKTLLRVAADACNVDKDTLYGYVNTITGTKNNRIDKLIENIITIFFTKNPSESSAGTGAFLNFGLALYRSIGTSKDPLYVEIKTILAYWMYDIIDIKQYYNREATWIAYTRAVFNYIVLMIHSYN